MTEEDQQVRELLADPAVQRALTSIGRRLPHNPCPRCSTGRVNTNSVHGFCSPCDREYDERVRASKRRSYHRRKGLPTSPDTERDSMRLAATDEVIVGQEGWRLLTVDEAARVLGVDRATVYRWISAGTLRSLLLGKRVRRIPSDAIVELVDRAADPEGETT